MHFCDGCNAPLPDTHSPGCPECGALRPADGWPRDARLGRAVVGGQYRVIRRLGAGGFGCVYLVETVIGGLQRALKILRPEWAGDRRMRERFINEALVLEELNHPNIARCFAVGSCEDESEQALYLLLELVRGDSVASALASADGGRRPLEPLRAVRIAKQVAAGLVVAHGRHVLHRDLKPQNILLASPGTPAEQVKIVDFGIARSLESDATTTGSVLGTPAFLAPEQVNRGSVVDSRADLWQLGVTLFLMLTGELPFETHTEATCGAEAGPRPGDRRPELAGIAALDRLVSSLLAADPLHRPRSAVQLVEELARIEQALMPSADAGGSIALIEALCAQPGEAAWRALCRYLMTENEPDLERLSAIADTLLRGWPDELRRAPLKWWDAVRRGGGHPCWPLVRALDLSSRGLGDADARELAAHPALSTITALSLADNGLSNASLDALAASPHSRRLRRLDVSRNRITSAGVETLAAGDGCAGVTHLSLAANGLGRRAAEALAAGRLALRGLDLSDNAIQAAGAAALASGIRLARLETLLLADNALGSDGVGALACSRTLASLQQLDVSRNAIASGGAAALALSSALGGVRHLGLAGNALGPRGVEMLLASNRFGALESLDLSSNLLGTEGAMALASSPFARRLKSLDVSDNALGDAGLAAMLGATHLSGLRVLKLAQNGLTPAGCTLLGGAPPELEEVDLSDNPLGPAGAEGLAAVLPRLRIRRIALNRTAIGTEGFARLLNNPGAHLERLAVNGCALDAEALASMSGGGSSPIVHTLDASGNALGPDGVRALTRLSALSNLRALDISSNDVGDERGAELARALEQLPALEELWLCDNGIGGRTADALSQSPMTGRVLSLDLSWNVLGDSGVAALLGRGWPMLHTLALERNDIGLGGASLVFSNSRMAMLHRINVARNALDGQVDVHSIPRRTAGLLQESFARLAAEGADFAERFYAALFARYPSLKPMFAGTPMKRQQQHLMSMLTIVIDNLQHPDAAAAHLAALGERHAGYGVSPSHYHAVTSILLETLRGFFGPAWLPEVEEAWTEGLEAIGGAMLAAHRNRPSPSVSA